jgi:3-phosphoshikimate 1-carboxyvinyltransferase
MAAQRAPGPVTVEVEALTSTPYVDITLEMIQQFGGRVEVLGPGTFRIEPSELGVDEMTVEGDYSAAAYPAAGAALTGGRVTLEGLIHDSRQGDRGFLDLLARVGAEVSWEGGEVTVSGRGLQAVEVDLSAMPDQVPTLAALAPFCSGVTRILNVPHLRIKESDRLSAMASELGKLGAPVEELADGLVLPGAWATPAPPAEAVEVEPHGDHRIAMSLALTGLRRPGVVICHPGVVAKSYPGFWSDLEHLLLLE